MKLPAWSLTLAFLGLGLLSACEGGKRICREPGYTCESSCEGDDCDTTPAASPKRSTDAGDGAPAE